jgi:hypothetical protein
MVGSSVPSKGKDAAAVDDVAVEDGQIVDPRVCFRNVHGAGTPAFHQLLQPLRKRRLGQGSTDGEEQEQAGEDAHGGWIRATVGAMPHSK